MGNRTVPFVEGSFYHVYNRGTDKRVTFLDHADYQRFLNILYIANTSVPINVRDIKQTYDEVFLFERPTALVAIGGYCLMPNHFHILLTPVVTGGVTDFMRKITTSYSMYFNKRYQRTGSLFQGAFKAEFVDSDRHLKYLYSYIHLNPVKLLQSDWKERGIVDLQAAYEYAASYSYSSLPDYLGAGRVEGKIISPEPFPAYFKDAASHRDELISWLAYK